MLTTGIEPVPRTYKDRNLTTNIRELIIIGDNRESNSGPSAPKAEIIPLDYYPSTIQISIVIRIPYLPTYKNIIKELI